MASRPHDELHAICRRAEGLAARSSERPSTAHLLLALAEGQGIAATLLSAHRASPATLAAALPPRGDEDGSAVRNAVAEARALAGRTRASGAASHHLLLALLAERKTHAYDLLARAGVDVGRLRVGTMQIAVGAVAPRRTPEAGQGKSASPSSGTSAPPSSTRPAARPSSAVAVSLVPKPAARTSAPPPSEVPPLVSSPRASTPPPAPREDDAPRAASGHAQRGHERASGAHPVAKAMPRATDRLVLDPKVFPVLSALGKNLSLAAASDAEASIVGREEEIERCLDVLAKRTANNPVLVGAPGVGKTSTLRGLARATASAEPESADARVLVEITVAELVAGTPVRGALAERLGAIVREVASAKGRVVLVFEDVHLLFTGAVDEEAGAELRLALAKGELPCVGTSTPEEYRRVIEQDPVTARRFAPILIEEPSREDARDILEAATAPLARHHRVRFPDDVRAAAVDWSVRYLPGRALPDKALSVLDLAGARASRRGQRDVPLEAVASVIAELADVPMERMLETDGERMLALESILAEDVVGHGPMLSRIAAVLRRNAAGIRGRRPIGSFLLLGPTGVGKTETAKAIARALFHSESAMTRLDLSEYAEGHAIARLIGAPPGYVGHEAGGQLTEAVRKRPYQVVLLDEIEKAHRDVLEAFLQVLDEGRLTDGRGRTVDFTSTVLVMTSNLGADVAIARPSRSIGFRSGGEGEGVRGDEGAVIGAARAALPPELYNRIDEVMAYAPLSSSDVREIARRLLGSLSRALDDERGVTLDVDDAVYDALVRLGGYDAELGARPMKRAIGKHVEAKLAELLLRGDLDEGDVARVTVDGNGDIVVVAPALADADVPVRKRRDVA